LTHINEIPARRFQTSSRNARWREEAAVLRFEDCLELCELSEEEIRAIAEHEHLPEIVALELGDYLMRGPDGELLVSHMFIEDIRAAELRGDPVHAAQLKRTLRHFIEEHFAQRRPGSPP
jgi:hypothetical protein